jgi:hypothetical protein
MTRTDPVVAPPRAPVRSRLQLVAVACSAAIALLYLGLFTGLLALPGAETGDLGILGVAGGVFAVLAGLLWWLHSRLLWAIGAVMQALLGWMYVAIAPERDPAFEVWGLTIRAISLVLFAALVALLVTARRDRSEAT